MLYFRHGDPLEADIFDDEDGVEGVGPIEEDKDEFYPDSSQCEAETEEKVIKPCPPAAAAVAAITEKVTSFLSSSAPPPLQLLMGFRSLSWKQACILLD